ncbi:MAG: TIGR03364 family FAD-dependent oxidoreductase [Acetobacteraceae bacterium]|nr:TIGR03364 family FAD-dependent oxidoreductase [Acetobacteraceae bacterium]
MEQRFDCLIVGAGIIGLAHALAAAQQGFRVAVLDRKARAAGASVRNFGFITVTGQQEGITWRRAKRTRNVWAEVCQAAAIPIVQHGLLMCARRKEALAVLEEFAATPVGAECRIVRGNGLVIYAPALRGDMAGALVSPHELRVESRDAIPRLTTWLQQVHGVTLLPRMAVHAVETGRVHTPDGVFHADHIVVCPGPDLVTLFPQILASRGITLCKLHMMRVAAPGWRLPAPVMSDLGLVRDLGYAGCASLPALRARLEDEQTAWLADGIHLIAVQSIDGSLVVGDSHHYDLTPDPFQPGAVDERILQELSAVLTIPDPKVTERWVGVYPSGPDAAFMDTPMAGVRLVMVTSGTGASTGFALAEETIADMLNLPHPPHQDLP